MQQIAPLAKGANKIDWKLDRKLPVSIAEQIKGQIIYAISFGVMQGGDALPSIRELALALKVSPVTVSKVYRELTLEGLLVTKPYIGVFVNEMGLDQLRSAHSNLDQIIDSTVRRARLMGYSLVEIRDAFQGVLEQMQAREQKRLIVVVGNFANTTSSYAADIAGILSDLNLEVASVTISRLEAEFDAWTDLLKRANLVVTIPQRLLETRALVEPAFGRVIAIAYELHPVTIQQLSAILPDQRVGIISTLPEFVQTMVNELESYGLNITPPLTVTIHQTKRIKEMLKQIDVLIYASGSEKVLDWVPPHVHAFELLHTPKAESVNRLRSLL